MNMTFRKATGRGRTSTKSKSKISNLGDQKYQEELEAVNGKEERGLDCSSKISPVMKDQKDR